MALLKKSGCWISDQRFIGNTASALVVELFYLILYIDEGR